jgi:hypothetical protein
MARSTYGAKQEGTARQLANRANRSRPVHPHSSRRPARGPHWRWKRHLCDVRHIFGGVRHMECRRSSAAVADAIRGLRMQRLNFTIATAIVLAAPFHSALGNERGKTYGNPSCTYLSDGKTGMCLTCPDGPCVVKTGSDNPTVWRVPDTLGARSTASRHLRAASAKSPVSANRPVGNENKRN